MFPKKQCHSPCQENVLGPNFSYPKRTLLVCLPSLFRKWPSALCLSFWNKLLIHFVNLSCWLHQILTNNVDCPTLWQKTLITRMHWSILVYVRGYSHDANFNFCFTWQEWSLSFFLLIDSKRFQRGDLNKNENQIEVTLPGPPASGATGLFHHIFVFMLLLCSKVGKTWRRRSHVCAIFQACCAIFLPVDTQVLYFLYFAVEIDI